MQLHAVSLMWRYFDPNLIVCKKACGSLEKAKLCAGIDKGPDENKSFQDGSYTIRRQKFFLMWA